ncbi:MAG: FecR family protein, partial [Burkholderiales bacterium]
MTFIYRLIAAALMLAALGSASAQNDPAVDPPGRVARLSEFSGQVWLYNTDSGEWVSAVRNRPITAGDRLATESGARAELQLGSTTVRLDSNTELEITALDDERLSLQLIDGSATARVVDQAGAGLFDLSTDEGRFVVQRNGSYRFDREGGNSRVSVYSGQARYEGPNSGLPVNAGQRAEFWIDSGGVAQYSMSAPVNDAFTAWNNDRDRRAVASVSARYVSPEMTGAEELDRYGRWEQNPEYGALWIPTAVAVDWAPYRSGHWAWVRPWGWTWVDDAPWGFAPFHYGRWVNVRNTWCWTPGARVARPVYAPALVAWVGG